MSNIVKHITPMEATCREIDELSEEKWFGHNMPDHKPGAVTNEMVKAKVDFLLKEAEGVHILNHEDEEGIQKAKDIMKVITRVFNNSDKERLAWKKRVDDTYKNLFGRMPIAKEGLATKLKKVDDERIAEMQKLLAEENEIWQRRSTSLMSLGMSYSDDGDQMELEGVKMSRLMIITSSETDLRAYLVKHIMPIVNRLKKEKAEAEAKEKQELETRRNEVNKALLEARGQKLIELGLIKHYAEGQKEPIGFYHDLIKFTISSEAVQEKTTQEFEQTLVGLKMMIEKATPKQVVLHPHTEGSVQTGSIPVSAMGGPVLAPPIITGTPDLHKSTEGHVVDHNREVIWVNWVVGKSDKLLAALQELHENASRQFQGDLAKHAAITYVKSAKEAYEKLKYGTDYLRSVSKDIKPNATSEP